METAVLIVILIIALALFFDFTNGFHDTANAMATPIATGALKPKVAVALAAVLNLIGAFLSTEVSKTISHGIIREDQISPEAFLPLIFAGLIGAITWNMLTWLLGLPSSSSHALFGGLIGATLVGVGYLAIDFGVVLSKVILPAVIAPVTAGVIAFTATRIAYALTRRYDGRPDGRSGFRWGQIFTSSLVALAHGTNDAQKTMGVITLALIMAGWQNADQDDPQTWVIFACAFAIALGTYMGGWRIIRTLGRGLTDVKPAQGFSAEASTASTILASSALGFALSTTQGCVGLGDRLGPGPPRIDGPLADGRAHRGGVAADASGRWRRGCRRGTHRRLVGGVGHPDRCDPRRCDDPRTVPAFSSHAGGCEQRDERCRRVRCGRRRAAHRAADPAPARGCTLPQGRAETAMTIDIDWIAFVQVFAAALAAATAVVGFYALGLRMLVRAGRVPVVTPVEFTDAITVISEKEAARAKRKAEKAARRNPLTATQKRIAFVAAVASFAMCAMAVLAGLLILVVGF